MRSRRTPLVLALGLMALGIAPAAMADTGQAQSELPISLLPCVPRGRLHPDPGMYLLSPHDADPGCVRLDSHPGEQVEKAPGLPESAVVLIHGLDDSGDVWRQLAPALHESGRTILFFEYPNDQGIACSADALGEALRHARSRGLARIDLVCHSMGGLVARDVLTREGFYEGQADGHDDLPAVDRVILIATPNGGAPLVWVRAPNDVIERTLAWRHYDASIGAVFDLSSDGDGQAGIDLRPGSEFLTDLNARPAPSGVHMTVIVAQAVGELEEAAEGGGERANEAGGADEEPRRRGVRARVGRWWSRLVRQVITALGDGAVPADSACLESADETLHVRCSHVGLLKPDPIGHWILDNTGQEPQRTPAVELVLERVSVASPVGDR